MAMISDDLGIDGLDDEPSNGSSGIGAIGSSLGLW
jgi:hypothetical protein